MTRTPESKKAAAESGVAALPVDRQASKKCRNKRATLRKQRRRVEERLAALAGAAGVEAGVEAGAGAGAGRGGLEGGLVAGPPGAHADEGTPRHMSVGPTILAQSSAPATLSADPSRPAVPSLEPLEDPTGNPKTRLGWGFWRN